MAHRHFDRLENIALLQDGWWGRGTVKTDRRVLDLVGDAMRLMSEVTLDRWALSPSVDPEGGVAFERTDFAPKIFYSVDVYVSEGDTLTIYLGVDHGDDYDEQVYAADPVVLAELLRGPGIF